MAAAAQKRKKREKITTPAGIAIYPYLHAPDTKFEKAGVYRTKLRLPAEDPEVVTLIELLEARMQASFKQAQDEAVDEVAMEKVKMADKPWSYAVTEDGKKDTSAILINFKMKASGTRQDNTTWTSRPALFDSQGTPLPPGSQIGGKSRIRVNFTPSPFYTVLIGAGISLRMNAVQVIDLVEFGSDTADGFGFDATEGFTADQLPTAPEAPATPNDEGEEKPEAGETGDF